MKKIILNSLIFIFTASVRLYCFDDILEDIFDDFEDFFRIVGIIAMIIIVMYFVKRFIKDDYNLKNGGNRKNENNENIPKIKYDKKENIDFIIDDSPDVCKSTSEAGIKTIFLHDSGIRGVEPNVNLFEVHNWGEIYRLLHNQLIK